MAAAPEVTAAFDSGSGLALATSYGVAVTVLGGLALIWLAWTVMRVGERVLDKRMTPNAAAWAAARAVVLAMLIVFFLVT